MFSRFLHRTYFPVLFFVLSGQYDELLHRYHKRTDEQPMMSYAQLAHNCAERWITLNVFSLQAQKSFHKVVQRRAASPEYFSQGIKEFSTSNVGLLVYSSTVLCDVGGPHYTHYIGKRCSTEDTTRPRIIDP